MNEPVYSHRSAGISLLRRVACPHCWETFGPEKTLWIAQHPELLGDVRLGPDQPLRFLPTRFNLQGAALDSHGFACHETACPSCHLPVPRAFYEMPPVFLSVLGGPASGKSYFLASMTWRLRQMLPKHFALGFNDADPAWNHRLQEYESMQFLANDPDALVVIEKTQTHGDSYDTVLFGEQTITYPKPFVFSLLPLGESFAGRNYPADFPRLVFLRQRRREFSAGRRRCNESRDEAFGEIEGAHVPFRSHAGHAVSPTLRRKDE